MRFPVRGLDLSPYLVPDGARPAPTAAEGETVEAAEGGGARGGGGGDDDGGGEGGGDGGAGRASGAAAEPPGISPRGSRSSEAIYDLYAVVHHLGALSAGHYVASVKAADGKWRCFNDSQVIETDEKELVSPSAYLLFYIRRDMWDAQDSILDEVWPQLPGGEGGKRGLSAEEIERLMRRRDSQRCTIA